MLLSWPRTTASAAPAARSARPERVPHPGIARIADLAVPGPGEWQARVWREDAAANRQPENASVPVTMRFDPEPPQLGFEPPFGC